MRLRAKRTIIILTVVLFSVIHLIIYMLQENGTNKSDNESSDNIAVDFKMFNRPPETRPSKDGNFVLTKENDILRNNSKVFLSLTDAHTYMEENVKNIGKSPRLFIQYSNFTRYPPKFIDQTDYETFMCSDRNLDNLLPNDYSQLRGIIEVIPNGTFQMDYSCGYKSSSQYLRIPRKASKHFDALVPLVIPMGFLFQHFFDGTFPKIVQAYPFIKQKNVKILLERPHHNNVYGILERLNITLDKVVWHQRDDTTTVYSANHMIFTCVTPPVHPELWFSMRDILGVHDHLTVDFKQAYVVYLTRAGATLGGRTAVNEKEVLQYLKTRYDSNFIVFDGSYSLTQAIKVFSQAKILIGTHGGAFYNLNYCPISTVVIEFVPVLSNGADIKSLPHAIFWAMAHILGMSYWRVPCPSLNRLHDMEVNVEKLKKILDRLD